MAHENRPARKKSARPAPGKTRTQSRTTAAKERLLRATLEAVADGILTVDARGVIICYNESFRRMWGLPAKGLAGRRDEEAVSQVTDLLSDPEGFVTRVEWYNTHPRESGVDILPLKDGRWVERITHPYALGGKTMGRVWCFRDITERKRAEDELTDNQKHLRDVIDSAPYGAHLYQLEDDHRLVFRGANRSADVILGIDHSTFIGMTIEEAFPPLTQTGIPDAYRRAAEVGERFDTEQVDYDGERIRGAFEVHAVQIGPRRMAAFFRDITERKKAETALRKSEEHYKNQASLLDMARDAIIVRDMEERVMFWNHGAELLYGWTSAEVMGKSLVGWMFRESAPFYAAKKELLERGEWRGEFQQLTRSGASVTVASSWSLVRGEHGEPESVLVINTDITRHRRLEEQLLQSQKMEAMGRLAGGIAHDFNNLLTVILGFSQMQLLNDDLDPASRGNIAQILQAAEGASNLTRQLLTFSRKQTPQPRVIDLCQIVHTITKMLQRIIGEDIQLVICCGPDLPPIYADPGMMEQVLLNLAVNARDAMPHGGRLGISLDPLSLTRADLEGHPRGRAGRFVRLEVRDNGSGMPPEVLARLFEPFFTTKGEGKGTGLGLATIYGIVEQHDGWLEVESRVNDGTVFRAFLPQTERGAQPAAAQPEEHRIPGGHETILIAEDQTAVRVMVRDFLIRLGYKVLEAESGPDAREKWAESAGSVDLLLTDMVMPGGDTGPELAEALRREQPKLRVIFSSGYTDSVQEPGGLVEGFNFVRKPFSLKDLAETVRKRLDAPEPPG